MFNIEAVRARVAKRVSLLRSVSEEDLHRVYAEEMKRELAEARTHAFILSGLIERNMMHHPKDRWLMISYEQRSELHARVKDILCALGFEAV